VLDHFGQLDDLRQSYRAVYDQLVEANARLTELAGNRTLRQQQLELYNFQATEIDTAEIQRGSTKNWPAARRF